MVHVESTSRRTELICADPTEATVRALLPQVLGDPTAMLTVVGADLSALRGTSWGAGIRVDRDDETLMGTDLVATEALELPEGLREEVEIDGPRITCRLIDSERVAAEATMAVDGGWATFDRVETLPSHRRRGLGRHVMSVLSARAVADGATRGILAASADGRALYASLGWTVERQLLSLMGEDLAARPADQESASSRAALRARRTSQVTPRYTRTTRAITTTHSHVGPPVNESVDSISWD